MEYEDSNVFAKIIRKELPARVVYEDEDCIAFHDAQPESEKHILVIPKGRYKSYSNFVEEAPSELVLSFFKILKKVALSQGMSDGFRIQINNGTFQHVQHFHVHLMA